MINMDDEEFYKLFMANRKQIYLDHFNACNLQELNRAGLSEDEKERYLLNRKRD
jgi:hypothetical protein